MKIVTTRYQPIAEVEFTWTDVVSLILYSERHYDHKCREMSDSAIRRVAKITWDLDCPTADLLAKVAECDPAMLYKMAQVVHHLNAEYRKFNKGNL